MTTINCEMKKCLYILDKGKKEGVCRFQCGNDEIEIGYYTSHIEIDLGDRPLCYSYEEKEE